MVLQIYIKQDAWCMYMYMNICGEKQTPSAKIHVCGILALLHGYYISKKYMYAWSSLGPSRGLYSTAFQAHVCVI